MKAGDCIEILKDQDFYYFNNDRLFSGKICSGEICLVTKNCIKEKNLHDHEYTYFYPTCFYNSCIISVALRDDDFRIINE